MMQLVRVSIENEMDLTLAYKKSIKAAELLGLSLSTQTAFATAVSEVCREVIDKTHEGLASIEVHEESNRFSLAVVITYKEILDTESMREGLQYARKLVPIFNHSVLDSKGTVELKLGIPSSSRINKDKISAVKRYFQNVEPGTAYEEVRQRNLQLFLINEQSELALRQAEYLIEQKNEFLSIASHELKTPLTILRAFIQMALKSDNDTLTMSHLKKVETQALKIQTMIQQLLDISRLEHHEADYNKEIVDFNPYIDNLSDLLIQLVPAHKLSVKLDKTATVFIDKLRMEQVITNIVGNAAKYSPKNTEIRLQTKIQSDGNVLISISDNGIGMSPDELNKIFDKFYRVEQVSKSVNGLGMGLFISSRIITNHSGKIWVESDHGKGSTFCFTIPLHS